MKRRTVLKGALAAAGAVALPRTVYAQSSRKMAVMTWNLRSTQRRSAAGSATSSRSQSRVEVEWIDKKGHRAGPGFYQTQIAAGTTPDVVNIQGALRPEYAGQTTVADLAPDLAAEAALRDRFTPGGRPAQWVLNDKNFTAPCYISTRSLLFLEQTDVEQASA